MPEDTSHPERIRTLFERYRGLALNLGFILYLIFLNPWVVYQLRLIVVKEISSPLWGWFLIGLMLAELIAIHLKYPAVRTRLQKARPQQTMGGLFLIGIWIAHMLVNVLLGLAAMQAFGINHRSDKDLFLIVILAATLKELYLLFYLMYMDKKTRPDVERRTYKREMWLDLVFFVYTCIGFSATWELMFGDLKLDTDLSMALFISAAFMFVFFLFYLPLRMLYLIEEWYVTKGTPAFRLTLLSLLLTYVGVLIPLWVGWLQKAG